jgi:hypothetical protein
MVPAKSQPVRIFAEDDRALEELTHLLRHGRAEVVHEALASGDLAALVRASVTTRQAEVDATVEDLPG